MGFYLRKAIRLGPIRLNLSKSGVGVSAGVTGLRVGVRPDGRQYVHAGRYGVYYRENLNSPRTSTTEDNQQQQIRQPDVVYATAAAEHLGSTSADQVLQMLRAVCEMRRTDKIAFFVTVIACIPLALVNTWIAAVIGVCGLSATVILFLWERARRSLRLDFAMDESAVRAYQKIVDGLNYLTSCSAVWMRESETYTSGHGRKISAGADQLIERSRIQIGSSDSMPWVRCNFSIPTIKTGRQLNYFLPNGIFVFENQRVGHVLYDELNVINVSTQRFIEEEAVPSDAQIVGSTWRYANKNGGPDRRFSNNYEIPVCLYGRMELVSSSGLHWLIETSDCDAPLRFAETAISGARDLASLQSPITPVGTKYFGQSFMQFAWQHALAISLATLLAGAIVASLLAFGDVNSSPSDRTGSEPAAVGGKPSAAPAGKLKRIGDKLTPKYQGRAWTDSTGRFTIEAVFVSYANGQVTIKRIDNGKVMTIPLDKLSESDNSYVGSLRK
jgi:hypothetical protein